MGRVHHDRLTRFQSALFVDPCISNSKWLPLLSCVNFHGGSLWFLVKALYDDFQCAVVDDQDTTEWFKIKTAVKQGCNMSGLLFLLVVDWVMRNTFQEGSTPV